MSTQSNHEQDRRAYWISQMEAAGGFMDQILDYPVEECGEAVVFLPQAVKDSGIKVEFSSSKLASLHPRLFYLRSGLIEDFVAVAREMNDRGWLLRVEDGFRSRVMQKDLAFHENIFNSVVERVMWESNSKTPDPALVLRRLRVLIASCPKIATHMSGSAIDVSVLGMDDSCEIDRGGPYLELSELTPMISPFVSADATKNRSEISQIMKRHGFVAYPYEFWHYSKGDAYWEFLAGSGKAARYGAVDLDTVSGEVTPIPQPAATFHSVEDIKQHIEVSLTRLNASN